MCKLTLLKESVKMSRMNNVSFLKIKTLGRDSLSMLAKQSTTVRRRPRGHLIDISYRKRSPKAIRQQQKQVPPSHAIKVCSIADDRRTLREEVAVDARGHSLQHAFPLPVRVLGLIHLLVVRSCISYKGDLFSCSNVCGFKNCIMAYLEK